MTALDQAIIKAYLRQGGLPTPDETLSKEPVGLPQETAQTAQPESQRPRSLHQPVETVRPAFVPFDALELTTTALPTGIAEAIENTNARSDNYGRPPFEREPTRRETSPSSAIVPANSQDDAFEPLLRIDSVSWPRSSRRLRLVADSQIERLADAIQNTASAGGKIIGVAGFSHGEGCTTVLLAVALRIVEIGQKTLLLDGDVVRPKLAEQLALDNETGWRDVALGISALEDVVTESEADSLAILPYQGRKTPLDTADPSEQAISTFIKRLRSHYDVVLVDLGGSLTNGGSHTTLAEKLTEQIDSILTVQNVRATSPADLASFRQHLRQLGVQEAGIIENFVEAGTA